MKEQAKKWALQWEKDTGKFPLQSEWLVKKNSAPIFGKKLSILFGNYNNFRKFCKTSTLRHNSAEEITLELLYKDTREESGILDTPCKVWIKSLFRDGYAQKQIKRVSWRLHRYVYFKLLKNKEEKGKTVDHICRNRACINAEHLKLSSNREQALNRAKYTRANNKGFKRFTKETTLYQRALYYLEDAEIQKNECLYCSKLALMHKINYYCFRAFNKQYMLHISLELGKTNPRFVKEDYIQFTSKYVTEHTCHDKKCINPYHLKRGNNKSNAIATRDARYHKGQKLSIEQVREIKQLLLEKPNTTLTTHWDIIIANQYAISQSSVQGIRLNNTWKDIKLEGL
jgi:hypothetical protein